MNRTNRLHRFVLALVVIVVTGSAAAQTLAYVADGFFGAVQVIDTATNTVIATVPVGPLGAFADVAAAPNGAFVYVTTSTGVSVISVATNTVVATVSVPSANFIAFTPNGAFAYVSSSALTARPPSAPRSAPLSLAEVWVIDTAKNKVVATIPVAQGLSGIAVTPDGALAYVGSEDASEYVIDTATNAVIATVPAVASLPTGLAITPDGAFVYVASLSDDIGVISTATQAVIATISGGGPSLDIAMTPNGAFAYVPRPFTGGVDVIDTATNTVAATVPFSGNPAFLAITPNGAFVYVADLDGSVLVIDTASNTVTTSFTAGVSLGGIDILVKPASPTTKEQCMNGGWATFSGPSFPNQGQCIAYVNGLHH